MSSRPPPPTPERDDPRPARQTPPVDLDRLAERILESDLVDIELWLRLKNA